MADLSQFSSIELILVVVIGILPIIPNLWAIQHAFKRDFPTVAEKMGWIGACVMVPVIAGLAYLFVGRRRAKPLGTYHESPQAPQAKD